MEKRRRVMQWKLTLGLVVVLCSFPGCGSDSPSGSEDQNEVVSAPERENNQSDIGAFVGVWQGDMDVYINNKRESESGVVYLTPIIGPRAKVEIS